MQGQGAGAAQGLWQEVWGGGGGVSGGGGGAVVSRQNSRTIKRKD